MSNFKILTEGERVFTELRTKAGETLKAAHGDVVSLLDHFKSDAEKEAHDAAIAAHVEAGHLVATAEAETVKAAVGPVAAKTVEELKAEADLVAKTIAAEKTPPAQASPATPAPAPEAATPAE